MNIVKLFSGVKVLELPGLAPVPFCGQILADYGADVVYIEKKGQTRMAEDPFLRDKKVISLDFKEDLDKLKKLCLESDVILDPFRPKVMESIGLNPLKMMEENKKLIIARITGYGQFGKMSKFAGHDINFVSMSGMLPIISGDDRKPYWPPANLLGDFCGGSLSAAFSIAGALYNREKTGKGCLIDVSMTDGVSYLSTFLSATNENDEFWGQEYSVFNGKFPLYRTYKTQDEKYIAVGALEPKFNEILFKTLNLPHLSFNDVIENPKEVGKILEDVFLSKTRDEWSKIFENKDACVTPVLSLDEVKEHPLHKDRKTFYKDDNGKSRAYPSPRIYYKENLEILQKSKI
uniref:Alpha-methylacyl-CoA racemase (inferred by orthology to a human protein) n=1 Tax=Strongyloides venezuelensis TaxID=75913 RepID=A0A0K0F1J6_STRVS